MIKSLTAVRAKSAARNSETIQVIQHLCHLSLSVIAICSTVGPLFHCSGCSQIMHVTSGIVRLQGPCFSFVRSDPDSTWNVDEMETTLNVCRCTLPPRSDGDFEAVQPARVYVMFKSPVPNSRTDNSGKWCHFFLQ